MVTLRLKLIAAVLACLVLLASLAACGDPAPPPVSETPTSAAVTTAPSTAVPATPSKLPVYSLVSPADAAALIAERGDEAGFVNLDVRTPEEFAAGHLAGAVNLNLNADDFETRIAAYDRDGTYLVYCRSGVRSRAATQIMQNLGFMEIYEISGGIVAWEADGQSVVK